MLDHHRPTLRLKSRRLAPSGTALSIFFQVDPEILADERNYRSQQRSQQYEKPLLVGRELHVSADMFFLNAR
jgi:hypothetical protein